MKAKDVSIWVKILAVCILVVGLVLKGLGIMAGITAWDIVVIAFACVAVFLDVSLNLIIDKIFRKKE